MNIQQITDLNSHLTKDQSQILVSTINILAANTNISGVLIYGSLVQGQADVYSDLDLCCYFKDENRTEKDKLIENISQINSFISRLWLYDKNLLILFTNGVRLDLDLLKPSDLTNTSQANAQIIYDPSGSLSSTLTLTTLPSSPPKWDPIEGKYITWYLWMFRQVFCWAKRAETNSVKSFEKLNNAVNSLSQIRNGLIDIRKYLLGKPDYLNSFDQPFAEKISASYPHFNSSEVIKCMYLLLTEYKTMADAYCKKVSEPYPQNEIDSLETFMNKHE